MRSVRGAVIKDMREAITTGQPAAKRTIPQPVKDHYMIDVRDDDAARDE